MPTTPDPNAASIAEFRANHDPPSILLLHTTGRRTRRAHIVPMRALPEGEFFYVFASAHGNPRRPDWYHNVVANPGITIEFGIETLPLRVKEVTGAERETIFARHASRFPIFSEYECRLSRTIPVLRLDHL